MKCCEACEFKGNPSLEGPFGCGACRIDLGTGFKLAERYASAPDLLEALEASLYFMSHGGSKSHCEVCEGRANFQKGIQISDICHAPGCPIVLARAAIAKAKGE